MFGGDGADFGVDAAMDSSGNIYVAGYTGGDFGGTNAGAEDVFVLKSGSDGTVAWVGKIGSSVIDRPTAITVDALGNVVVVGTTEGMLTTVPQSGGGDFFVGKFSSVGSRQWLVQLGASDFDKPTDVSTDADGNVYVVGQFSGPLPGKTGFASGAPFLMKLSGADGRTLWANQFGNETTFTVGVSVFGNFVFVAGHTSESLDGNPIMGNKDLFVFKCDLNNTSVWRTVIAGAGYEYATGFSVLGTDLYISGSIIGEFGIDGTPLASTSGVPLLVKLSALHGTYVWSKAFDAMPEYANYVIGPVVALPGSSTIALIRSPEHNYIGPPFLAGLNATGDILWCQRASAFNNMVLTEEGVLVVTTQTESVDGQTIHGEMDACTMLYNVDGCKL